MGILDDAIKEHLELKRQHGAGDSELKKLEDEAFGAAERPGSEGSSSDQLAEAPTEFMTQPELEASDEKAGEPEDASEESVPSADVDASAEADASADTDASAETAARGRTEIADLQEPPVESVDAVEEAPAEEQSPAMEHEAITDPPGDEVKVEAGPSTEERHAISEHPTEMYDVEAELGEDEPTDAEPEVHALADEQALSEEDEEFWDEKRLSDELDQALEAPAELQEPDLAPRPPEPDSAAEPAPSPEPIEPPAAEEEAPSAGEPAPQPSAGHEDALDETPDFLEDKPEDDQLWFEQKPPKDFDFDD
jgi:hypothetical protein